MTQSTKLAPQLERLQQLIATYEQQASLLEQQDRELAQRLEALQRLRLLLKQLTINTTASIQEDDDWKAQLAQADLPDAVKKAITETIEAQGDEQAPKLVKAVEEFYTHRYHNPKKYLEGLNLPETIDEATYRSYLEAAVFYCLKQKGTAARAQDLGVTLMLLLKGRLKVNEALDGEAQVKETRSDDGLTQVNLQLSKELKKVGAALTQKIQGLSLFKKAPFEVDAVQVDCSVTLVGSYESNKVVGWETGQLGGWLSAGLDTLSQEIIASIKPADLGAAFAGAEGKLSLDLGVIGVLDVGIKMAELSMAFKEGVNFQPFKGYAKLAIPLKGQRALLGEAPPNYWEVLNAKLEIECTLTPSIGLKKSPATEQLEQQFDKLVQEQERIVREQQNDFNKRQLDYNDAVDQKKELEQLQRQSRQLDAKRVEVRGTKGEKELAVKRGKLRATIRKKKAQYDKHLQRWGADNLQQLQDDLVQRSAKLDQALKQAQQRMDNAISRIKKPATQLAAQLLKKQAAKRLVSLAMKAVPVLNVISLAVDLYDAYTLVRDLSQSYMEADTQLDLDEELNFQQSIMDVNEMPTEVVEFMEIIGAGGRLIELTREQVEELSKLIQTQCPLGSNDVGFMDLAFDYSEVYAITGKGMNDSKEFIGAVSKYISTYDKTSISVEGKVTKDWNEDSESKGTTSFFQNATYSIVEGNPEKIGEVIKVDAVGKDTNSKGETRQISFPDDVLLELIVVQDLGDGMIKLEVVDDFILEVEKFKKYKMHKGSDFIYYIKRETIEKRKN